MKPRDLRDPRTWPEDRERWQGPRRDRIDQTLIFEGLDDCYDEDGNETMVDLGGGMVVPLRELLDDA